MTLTNILILTIILAAGLQFWRLRGISQTVLSFAKSYCAKEGLQFLALARNHTRIAAHKGKLDWKISYALFFSGDGETEYVGTIEVIGKQIVSINLPAYRLPN